MVNSFLAKLFTANDAQTIEFCRLQFSFKLSSELVATYRYKKFGSSRIQLSFPEYRQASIFIFS